jgi:hypothetical protein
MSRRKSSPALLALAVFLAATPLEPPAASAAGLDLRWDECAADAGVSNKNFACDTDVGEDKLVASIRLDQPLTNVIFFEVVLDFIVANSQVVPPWWEWFDCRQGLLFGDANIYAGATNCVSWHTGNGLGGVGGFNHEGSIAPADTASHRRILAFGAHLTSDYPDLVANQDYFLLNVLINRFGTTGPSACAGCLVPVCIVLNSVHINPQSANEAIITTANSPGSNFATWQGGAGANCANVPVKQVTWGAVKALYR